MKTTPLPEILKQITPLPYLVKIAPPQFKHKMNIETRLGDRIALVDGGSFWDIGEHSASQGGNRAEASAAYLAHAANVLPELVEALQAATLAMMEKAPGEDERQTSERRAAYLLCTKALSLATNVPTP